MAASTLGPTRLVAMESPISWMSIFPFGRGAGLKALALLRCRPVGKGGGRPILVCLGGDGRVGQFWRIGGAEEVSWILNLERVVLRTCTWC